jgi:ribosomal protein L37AE/L43A
MLNGTDGTQEGFAVTSKAPDVYCCPCCGSTFVHRRAKACPQCDIPVHLEGEYMVKPCYVYLHKEGKWVWIQGRAQLPWEDGWKRRPKTYKSQNYPWLEQYPGRPTGLPHD